MDEKYWKEGTSIIEKCLDRAIKANPSDAPFPLFGEEAKIYHEAQANAYRHALEMMGFPSP